jgi:hypothetical protein
MPPKGKWAQGITPRHFFWIIQDKLAVCERPGGYGTNHRRVRRQEEIIWIREQAFSPVISLISTASNLHNYDELGVSWRHRPFPQLEDLHLYLPGFYRELNELLTSGHKVLMHFEELGDKILGLLAGYLVWSAMVPEQSKAIFLVEHITSRQLTPQARETVALAHKLSPANQ